VQKAAKALYEAAKEAFEKVKVSLQRLVELFVEAVTRVLAWIDEHKAYLFLMAAVAAGVVALSVALNLWGLVELEKPAYAASTAPFISAGVREYSREEAFKILREAPDPYEKFKDIAKAANVGRVKLAREGIIEFAYIAKHGTDEAQRLGAASLIEHLRIKAELAGKEVLVKLGELVREGESRRSLHAEGLKTIVEIEWKGRHVEVSVEVKNIKAWEDGDKLRIVVGAIVGGVEGQWTATFRRTKKNAIEGYTVARVNAPGGREEDAKRIIALVKALTGEEPNIKLDKGKPVIIYTRRHLNGFKKYAEVADTIREREWKSVYARRG